MKKLNQIYCIYILSLIGTILLALFCAYIVLTSCTQSERTISGTIDNTPNIFPDYSEVTIPRNIAPLSFQLKSDDSIDRAVAVIKTTADERHVIASDDNRFIIPQRIWRKLIDGASDGLMSVTVDVRINGEWLSYKAFNIHISDDAMDPYIAYRLIEPGYEIWDEMGIYQRNLTNYSQSAIAENTQTKHNCMNCHSFCMQDPSKMLFHYRESYAGTMLLRGDTIEKLNTKTPGTISALVYPSWHPSGRFVAFSVNTTRQAFHTTDPNRIEVYDLASDVVVYDVQRHEIVTDPKLSSGAVFETFPTFAPDGRTLYFCAADSTDMPRRYEDVHYSLCAVAFDPATRTFGTEVDTLYNASLEGGSVSFPRVSPDGRFLMFTLSSYGNFSIWHKDADLYLLDLGSRQITRLDALNSDDVESYHSWSSNSRWIVFSSRRIDGLYTRPFFAHVAADGTVSKPFLLPQKDPAYYMKLMKSYNIPEFIKDKVRKNSYDFSRKAINDPGVNVALR